MKMPDMNERSPEEGPMRLSLVTPAYNEEACIGKFLSSVLKEKERNGLDVEVLSSITAVPIGRRM